VTGPGSRHRRLARGHSADTGWSTGLYGGIVRSVHDADGITVYDDVLTDAAFQRLREWSESVRYQGVHHQQWRTVWRHGEGEPLRGPNWIAAVLGVPGREPLTDLPAPLGPLASVLQSLLRPRQRRPDQITFTPWIYPQGTALGLHKDDRAYDGSYIFYTVPEWDVHWGGLLHCVADPPRTPVAPRAVLDLSAERRSVATVGRGTWISPGRNRLVIIAPQVRHFISRVDPNAGDRPRTSIAGFFRHVA
jgi:hypothetical protein